MIISNFTSLKLVRGAEDFSLNNFLHFSHFSFLLGGGKASWGETTDLHAWFRKKTINFKLHNILTLWDNVNMTLFVDKMLPEAILIRFQNRMQNKGRVEIMKTFWWQIWSTDVALQETTPIIYRKVKEESWCRALSVNVAMFVLKQKDN